MLLGLLPATVRSTLFLSANYYADHFKFYGVCRLDSPALSKLKLVKLGWGLRCFSKHARLLFWPMGSNLVPQLAVAWPRHRPLQPRISPELPPLSASRSIRHLQDIQWRMAPHLLQLQHQVSPVCRDFELKLLSHLPPHLPRLLSTARARRMPMHPGFPRLQQLPTGRLHLHLPRASAAPAHRSPYRCVPVLWLQHSAHRRPHPPHNAARRGPPQKLRWCHDPSDPNRQQHSSGHAHGCFAAFGPGSICFENLGKRICVGLRQKLGTTSTSFVEAQCGWSWTWDWLGWNKCSMIQTHRGKYTFVRATQWTWVMGGLKSHLLHDPGGFCYDFRFGTDPGRAWIWLGTFNVQKMYLMA